MSAKIKALASQDASSSPKDFARYQAKICKFIETKFPKSTDYAKTSAPSPVFPFDELAYLLTSTIFSTQATADDAITTFLARYCRKYDAFKYNTLLALQTHLETLGKSLHKDEAEFVPRFKKITRIIMLCVPEKQRGEKNQASKYPVTKPFNACWTIICKIMFLARNRSSNLWPSIAPICLALLPRHAFPHLDSPGDFMDLLNDITANVSRTREYGLFILALDALLILVTRFRLDVPDFYSLLFKAMLWLGDDRVMDMLESELSIGEETQTPKSILFRLLQVSLISAAQSALIAASIPAAFAKRAAQLLLKAPTPTAMWLIPFIYELIQTYPSLVSLIHRPNSEHISTNFVETETEPLQSKAINSSLWELDIVKKYHISSSVSSFVSIFCPENFRPNELVKRFNLEKYSRLTHESMAREYSLLDGTTKRSFQCALSAPCPSRPVPMLHQYNY